MSSEEKRQHSSQLKPFSYYECKIPEYFSSVPLHWHGEFEINYIKSGSAIFICGDKKFITNAGDIVIVKPNTPHAIYPREGFCQSYDTIVFSPNMLGLSQGDRSAIQCIKPILTEFCEIIPLISQNHTYYGELKTTAENIFSCAKGNEPSLDLLMKSELLRLVWLLRESEDIIFRSESGIKSISKSEIIRPAIEYMSLNFSEDISISKLCEIVHLSKSYFFQLFKDTAGVGAMEYLTQIRIKNVCDRLIQTDKSTSEIAFECGFKNLSNFNRCFKRLVGITPREYRKNLV